MKLLVTANPKEIAERSLWFKSTIAQKLTQEKRVEFGFEIKEPLSYLKTAPTGFWGIHLPNDFANEWYYYPTKRKALIAKVKKLAKLKPNYVVIHGIKYRWNPPLKEYVHRYVNTGDSSEYLKMFRAYAKLLNELKTIVPLKFENHASATHYLKDGKLVPQTHLYSGTTRLEDIIYFKRKTKVHPLVDIEHLNLTLNLLNREQNYRELPKEKAESLSPDDLKLKKICGYTLKKYFIPYTDKKVRLEDVLKKAKATYYHVTGSTRDVFEGKRIAEHGPIRSTNKTFSKQMKAILKNKPEVIVTEVANGTMGKSWKHLKKNESEVSFYELCKVLLEEL